MKKISNLIIGASLTLAATVALAGMPAEASSVQPPLPHQPVTLLDR